MSPLHPGHMDTEYCTWAEVRRLQAIKRADLERVEALLVKTELRAQALLQARQASA